TFQSSGLGSNIKLNNVQTIDGRTNNDGVLFNLSDHGSIDVSNVQTLMGVGATVKDGLVLDLSSATSYGGGDYLTHTLQAIGLGSRIDLSGLTTFAGANNGNVLVAASDGGEVDMSKVVTINNGTSTFRSTGVGSRIKLSHAQSLASANLILGDSGAIDLPV